MSTLWHYIASIDIEQEKRKIKKIAESRQNNQTESELAEMNESTSVVYTNRSQHDTTSIGEHSGHVTPRDGKITLLAMVMIICSCLSN